MIVEDARQARAAFSWALVGEDADMRDALAQMGRPALLEMLDALHALQDAAMVAITSEAVRSDG